jgi:hypothetical protein
MARYLWFGEEESERSDVSAKNRNATNTQTMLCAVRWSREPRVREIYIYLGKAFDAMVTKAAQSVVCAMDISSIVLRSSVTYSPLSPISKLRFLTASATASPGLASCKI